MLKEQSENTSSNDMNTMNDIDIDMDNSPSSSPQSNESMNQEQTSFEPNQFNRSVK